MKRGALYIFVCTILLFSSFGHYAKSQDANAYLSFEHGFLKNTEHESTLPARETVNGDSEYYSISFDFSGAHIASTMVEGVTYQFLHIDGFTKMGQVGAPALPSRKEVIALPPDSEARIRITGSEYFEYDGFMIHPALEPARDTEGAPEPEFWIDTKVYSTDSFFPEKIVEIGNVGLMRGIPLAYTLIRPVQFNPATGVIRVYTSIEFMVEYEGTGDFAPIANKNSLHFTNLLKRNVINSENIPDGIDTRAGGNKDVGDMNYIIITHDQYLTAANTLANWKRQLGYGVEIVSQSSWTYTQVESAIQTRYDTWTPRPDYFVIIGDHTGSYAIPGEVINTPYSAPNDGPFATDLYFACMDGSTDWHPDLAHGRISVSSLTEANVIINKIINYEKTPPTTQSFYDNVLNCAQYQDDDNDGYADRRFCHTTENIRDYLQDEHGYTSERVYYTSSSAPVASLRYNNGFYSNGEALPAELTNGTFNWSGDQNDITPSIDAGKFMVFHRDHGYVGGSGWAHPYYTTSTMTSLSNGELQPIVFSMNCHTGEYQLDNCFAEKLMRMENKGAVGVVGAAYFSLSGWNDALSLGMIDAIWATPGVYATFGSGGTGTNYTIGAGNEIYTMGDVVNQGLYAMEQNWDGDYTPATADILHQYEYELFMYFGDPAMKIWTENPNLNAIAATHNATIDCAGGTFAISGSEPNAVATLFYNDELLGAIELNGSGSGSIPYSIDSPGTTVTLTISQTNCKPYIADLSISGPCSFPPELSTNAASAITSSGATLNAEITETYSQTVSESGFVYSTTNNPVIGGPGVIQVQTSPVVTTGAFAESISGLTPATIYYYKAYAISPGGTGYGNQQSFTTLCGLISTLPITQEFTTGSLPACWFNIDNQGSGQVWTFTDPVPRPFLSTTAGNGYAILDSDQYGNGGNQNSDLVTPELDLSGYVSVNLAFEHLFKSYSGSSATLSYSINGGANWTVINSWTSNVGNSTSGAVETFSQDMTAEVAGQSSVMFKWNYTGSWGYYWIVDDVSITGVEGSASVNQTIPLTGGWNILSFCITPPDPDMVAVVQPLIDAGTLVKVSDEAGGLVQYISGSWMNTIGDMVNTEGYYINVSGTPSLSCDGSEVTFPFDIPLSTGWNIMGYPCDVSQDAITVLQPLIDDGYLVKVIDQSGGFIQFITGMGWVNSINTFEPGEGYYINVNTNCTLSLSDPGKGTEPYINPDQQPTVYFASSTSNPYSPMNVVIRDIYTEGFEVENGDEVAVYDGEVEVGSMVIEDNNADYLLVALRADDPLTEIQDGFISGGELSFRYWDKSENTLYADIQKTYLFGTNEFTNLGTYGTDLKIGSLGIGNDGLPVRNFLGQNFPNPFTSHTIIEYGLAANASVSLSIFDISGRKISTEVEAYHDAGLYQLSVDASAFESGIYYYRLEVSGNQLKFTETRKMIIH